MEKATEGRPNSRSVRFSAAYTYGSQGLSHLALLHYLKQLEYHPEDTSTINNLGVETGRLEMPGRSIAFYKKAGERDETLAMANLANYYINAGFFDEAAQILDKARSLEAVHPNVGASLAALAAAKEAERELVGQCLGIAQELQAFASAFGEAAFIDSEGPGGNINLAGHWRLSDGTEFEVTQEGNSVVSKWIKDGRNYSLVARKLGRACIGVIGYKSAYLDDSKRFISYIDENGEMLRMLIVEGKNKYKFVDCKIET